jgi:L-seryl-tRNA(Ser) seleniumtransferase
MDADRAEGRRARRAPAAEGRGVGSSGSAEERFVEDDARRHLPAVSVVLGHELLREPLRRHGRLVVRRAVRTALEELRRGMREGRAIPVDPARVAGRAREILGAERAWLRPAINATGVLLHTGLGRAPLARRAIAAVAEVAAGYCNLELDLDDGTRGRRTAGIAELLRGLTGAEAATVVNNNAGATVLALRALAVGREVIVARGQLVEIGGSFRLPEIFEVSGARLREVGTTNKTRLLDYRRVIGPETAAILRVHRSNFRIVGFTEEPALPDLVQLAHAHGIWAIDDIGSGALRPGCPPGVGDEPTAAQALTDGADLVLFSGDKLLGGPQCGIMAGSREAIGRIEVDPLMRALRVDKMTLAALEATLRLAGDPEHAADQIPLWKMMATPLPLLTERAERLAAALRAELGLDARAIADHSFIGGGSVPIQPIPTAVVALAPPFPAPHESEAAWARALRRGQPAVVARLQGGRVLLDLRTVAEDQEPRLLEAIRRVCREPGAAPADRQADSPDRADGPAGDGRRPQGIEGLRTT